MDSTADRYAKEPVRYPALHVVDLAAEGAAVTERYRNMVISRVNDSNIAPMKEVVKRLSIAEMIDISSYLATLH